MFSGFSGQMKFVRRFSHVIILHRGRLNGTWTPNPDLKDDTFKDGSYFMIFNTFVAKPLRKPISRCQAFLLIYFLYL